ncbi:MAG: hypothetical protein AAGG68_26830 [Bacteroidota bacterium]
MSKKNIAPIDELHNKAMALADEAYYARKKGEIDSLQTLYYQAFEYEKAAAMLLVNDYEAEPSRSVLFRSAASLLLNLPEISEADFRAAEQMIAFGLSGNPPAEIADELRDVWMQIKQKYVSIHQSFQGQANTAFDKIKQLFSAADSSVESKTWLINELKKVNADLEIKI